MIELSDRREIADAETAVNELHGQRPILCGLTAVDIVLAIQIVDQLLRTADVACCAVTEQHCVFARRFGEKIRVERQQSEDPVHADTEVLSDESGRRFRHISVEVLRFLACLNDEFKGILVIRRMIVFVENASQWFKVNFSGF